MPSNAINAVLYLLYDKYHTILHDDKYTKSHDTMHMILHDDYYMILHGITYTKIHDDLLYDIIR